MARKKQEYYQKTESLLYKYNFIKLGIETMEEELKGCLSDYGLGSVDPGKEVFKTNKISSVVESTVIKRNDSPKVITLKQNIKSSRKLVKKIDRAFKQLEDDERKIIELYYLNGLQWYQVAAEIHYSDKWCSELRRRAIEKIAIALAFAIVIEVDREQQAV